MLSVGMDYRQKNKARRLYAEGATSHHISQAIMVELGAVERFLATLDSQPTHDDFGPLPGSPAWDDLPRGARGGLTRKRNNHHA